MILFVFELIHSILENSERFSKQNALWTSLFHSWTWGSDGLWGEAPPCFLFLEKFYVLDMRWIRFCRSVTAHLSFGTLLIGRIHEDPAVGDGAVNIGHHGAHITGAVRGAAVLQVLTEKQRRNLLQIWSSSGSAERSKNFWDSGSCSEPEPRTLQVNLQKQKLNGNKTEQRLKQNGGEAETQNRI